MMSPLLHMNPTETLRLLQSRWPNSALNWEGILSAQYHAALQAPRCIVDVGANLGMHLAQFVQMACPKVLAFEPIPELAARLRAEFPEGSVTVYEGALAATEGEATFYIDPEVLSESGLRKRADKVDRPRVEVQVQLWTLDSFALTDVDYIKIDTEGADLLTLEGGTATIDRCRPLVSVEYGWAGYHAFGFAKDALLRWADSHEYAVCDLFGGHITADVYDACVDRYYWDFFLRPIENHALDERLRHNGQALLANLERFVV